MALTKVEAEGINLADTFAFTGTVSGAGGVTETSTVDGINIYSSLNKAWWNIDENNNQIDDSMNVSSHTDISTGAGKATLSVTMANTVWTCCLCNEKPDNSANVYGGLETTTVVPWRNRYVGGSSASSQDVNNLHGILTGDLA
jgi:hypothetical protein